MPLKPLDTPVPGHVGGSARIVLAVRGDGANGQLEVTEVRDNSVALGDIPSNAVCHVVAAGDFRPWPQRTVFVGGQPFVFQWAERHATCAQCGVTLEHFGYTGMPGGDVREHGQGAGHARAIWYCDSCVRGPFDIEST